MLCGVEIPHDRGLDGHSDADVAVHALMDALLGALGEGDIGRHFPDSDPTLQGHFLDAAAGACDADRRRPRLCALANADVTIVAQKPKLAGVHARRCAKT